MEIQEYVPGDTEEYKLFLRTLYNDAKSAEYSIVDSCTAFTYARTEPDVNFFPIRAMREGVMVGHMALIKDARLPKDEAFFGFMDVPEDKDLFNDLWTTLSTVSKREGVRVLKGPIQGSIWHSYRCVSYSDGSAYVTSEPLSKDYYHSFLTQKNPIEEIRYVSASRSSFSFLLPILKKATEKQLQERNMRIEEVPEVSPHMAQTLYTISLEAFSESFAYTPLSPKAFAELYAKQKLDTYVNSLYVLYDGETVIGFLSTSHEDAKTLICKTIALKPSYQGQGLGKALAYRLHKDALARGYKKIIYALIRRGNGVYKFPTEHLTIFREYSAFTFRL